MVHTTWLINTTPDRYRRHFWGQIMGGTWRKRQLRHREPLCHLAGLKHKYQVGGLGTTLEEGRGARAAREALSTMLNVLRFNTKNEESLQRFKSGKDAFQIHIPESQSWQQCKAWIG